MSAPFRLSVLVPVFNEEGTVRTLLERVMAVPLDKDIVVVDDCSTDGTADLLAAFRAEHPDTDRNRLVLVRHEVNQGKGAAVRTAIRHVTGDIVVIQDADLEYDPAEYPKLVQPIVDDLADVVYGSRFSGSRRRVVHFWHMLGNRTLTVVSNMLTNLWLTDMETCYKAFRADVLKRIPLRSNRFGLEPELTAKVAHLRCRVYEVPISYTGRQFSEGKKIGVKDAVSALWTMLRFAAVPDIGREDAGFHALRRVEVLQNYNAFIWQLVRPYVGHRILEVGAGTGLLTRYLATREHLVTTDADPQYVEFLRRTYGERPNVEVRLLDVRLVTSDGIPEGAFDTVVCLNVLAQVADDTAALRAMRHVLAPGGRVIVVVPAVPALYGTIDQALASYRRYSKDDVARKLADAGFTVEQVRPFNMVGVAGWFLNSRILRRHAVPGIQARINDALVPLLRWEQRIGPPVGMSLVAVGRAG